MRILLPSSGAREDALGQKFYHDGHVIFTDHKANVGMRKYAHLVDGLDRDRPESILYAAEKHGFDLTVIGGESNLERGIVNLFEEAKQPIVGPTAMAARLETSKWDACRLLTEAGVKIPNTMYCQTIIQVRSALNTLDEAVVKPDRGTRGQGVFVMHGWDQRKAAVAHVHEYPGRYLVQKKISGKEVSFFVAANGTKAVFLGSAADYKLLGNLMTGGMGGYAPNELCTDELKDRVMDEVVESVLQEMVKRGAAFRGILYVQLMIQPDGQIFVIEFNVRFGDPEAQLLMPLYKGDLAELLASTCKNRLLDPSVLQIIPNRYTVGYVLAAYGYPGKNVCTGDLINGVDKWSTNSDVSVYHGGTSQIGQSVYSAGGRVLTVVGKGLSYEEAQSKARSGRDKISFSRMQFRDDIAAHLV